MKIDVEVVRELRQISGAGLGDCKEALEVCSGDMDKAKEYLREKGLSKAYKKANRDVAEGLVAMFSEKTRGVLVKLGCETDFVARNERFCDLALCLSKCLHSYEKEDLDGFLASRCAGSESGHSVKDEVIAAAAVLGENVVVGGVGLLQLEGPGVVGSYVHAAVREGLGKAAALVALESNVKDLDALANFAKQIAMHVVAAKPEALSVETLDPEVVERERAVFEKQVEALGKPAFVAQKVVDGRMQKFFEDMVLLEQVFVIDNQTKIRDLVQQKGQSLGGEIRIVGYRLLSIGG